ncbi:MAG: hypothetical protein RLZZ444_1129 [Pseudomonadota bacterium]
MNIISHVEIAVTNLERAVRFYTTLFDIEFTDPVLLHDSRMAYFPFDETREGASGALCEGPAYVPTVNGSILYFVVNDIDATIEKAIAQGSEILFPKTLATNGIYVAEISDSEGNRIALQMA